MSLNIRTLMLRSQLMKRRKKSNETCKYSNIFIIIFHNSLISSFDKHFFFARKNALTDGNESETLNKCKSMRCNYLLKSDSSTLFEIKQ